MAVRPFLALSVLFLAIIGQVTGVGKSGPYDYIMEKIDKCEDTGAGLTSFPTRLSKVSRNKATLSGFFVVGSTVDEHSKLYVDVQQFSNQGYRPRSFQLTLVSCQDILKKFGDVAKHVFASAGVNVTGCPLPAGNYSITNMEFNFKNPVPVMIYSRFRLLVSHFQRETKMGCSMFYVETLPKEKHK